MAVIVLPVVVGPVIVVALDRIGLTHAGAFPFTERAALRQTLHMVMVAFLGPAHILFKAEHLGPVFTERTIHCGVAAQHLLHPFAERVDHFWVITQVPRRQEFHFGVIGCHRFGVLTDPAHQHS